MWHFSKKILKLFASKEFIKFFMSGFSAFLVDTATLLFQTRILHFTSVIAGVLVVPNLISSLVGLTVSYLLNRYWSFQAGDKSVLKQGAKFLAVSAFSYTLHNILFGIFNVQLGLEDFVAKVSVLMLQMVWNYLLYKYVVFNK
jgi:putative flippase GtrA